MADGKLAKAFARSPGVVRVNNRKNRFASKIFCAVAKESCKTRAGKLNNSLWGENSEQFLNGVQQCGQSFLSKDGALRKGGTLIHRLAARDTSLRNSASRARAGLASSVRICLLLAATVSQTGRKLIVLIIRKRHAAVCTGIRKRREYMTVPKVRTTLEKAVFYSHSERVTLPPFFINEYAPPLPSSVRALRGGAPAMHDIWKDMFVTGLPLAEKILRPIIVYAFLVVSLRLSGKRELVQLNPFDLVVLLTLSNTVQNAIIGEDNSVLGGIIGATSLLVTNYLVVRFLYDHRKIDQFVEGRADVLVEGGKVRTQRLKKELITMAQLEAAARKQGFESLSEVDQCVLEPGGTLTFVAKKPATEDVRHQELLAKLERLTQEIAILRGSQPPARA